MKRFFFDFEDGDELLRDEEGQLLRSRDQVRNVVGRMMPSIALDEALDRDDVKIGIKVRDETGKTVFLARLEFHVSWVS